MDDIEKARELGKLITPFLLIGVTTHLIAARYQARPQDVESADWRRRVIVESIKDAQLVLEVV